MELANFTPHLLHIISAVPKFNLVLAMLRDRTRKKRNAKMRVTFKTAFELQNVATFNFAEIGVSRIFHQTIFNSGENASRGSILEKSVQELPSIEVK